MEFGWEINEGDEDKLYFFKQLSSTPFRDPSDNQRRGFSYRCYGMAAELG